MSRATGQAGSDTLYALAALTVGTIAGSDKIRHTSRAEEAAARMDSLYAHHDPAPLPPVSRDEQRRAASALITAVREAYLEAEATMRAAGRFVPNR